MLREYIRKKGRVKRVTALALILALIVPYLKFPAFAAERYDDHLDGWKVDCCWSDVSYDYVWNSVKDEVRRPKLVFTYRIENASRDYGPGSISVDIPGIGSAYRDAVRPAYELPTDREDSEWDVLWDQNHDIYTFTNRFEVKQGQSVNGGFEMMWELGSRELINGYEQRKAPSFTVSGEGDISLRPLKFSFTSKRDTYSIRLESSLVSAVKFEKLDRDHIWYEITTSFDKTWLARGLDRSDCVVFIELPDGADEGDIICMSMEEKTLPLEKEGGELKFCLFEDRKGNLGSENTVHQAGFLLGLSREKLTGREVVVREHLDRLYRDESEWVREGGEGEEVDAYLCLTAEDYGFTYNGLIYDHDLWNVLYENYDKPPHYYTYKEGDELTHAEPMEYEERLCAQDLYNGTVVNFSIRGSAVKDYSAGGPARLLASPASASPLDTGSVYASPSDIMSISHDLATASNALVKAGAADEYAMILGDDLLAVFMQNGSLRFLEDDEYDLVSVELPYSEKGYEYEIWGASSRDKPFEEYELLKTSDMSSAKAFLLPEGIKAAFVRINGINGNFDTNIRLGVSFHLNWKEEQEKEPDERCDHENRLVNLSFFRALCPGPLDKEENDAALTAGDYGGTLAQELAERDHELYGEWLMRDYSNVWLRGAATTLKASVSLEAFRPNGKEAYVSKIAAGGSISADTKGELRRFSVYTVLPEGLRADLDSKPIETTGRLLRVNGSAIEDPSGYVSFSEGSYNGKKMLIADFDFRTDPLKADALNQVRIYFPVTLSYADQAFYGDSYTVTTYLLPHDEGLDKIIGSAIVSDEYDIDKNGVTGEKMAYASAKEIIEKNVEEWREYVSKYVKTAYSEGYTTEAATRRYREDMGLSENEGSFYEYRLDFGVGSSRASNIVFYDHIEEGALLSVNEKDGIYEKTGSEWQGVFCGIDTSFAESLGLKPVIYYSENADEPFDLASPGWSSQVPSDKAEVRSIAISLDASDLSGGALNAMDMIYVILKMKAPGDEALLGKKAVNQYSVSYDSYGPGGEYEKSYILPSAAVEVTLLDSVGKITLQKVDADNVIREDADGNKYYASLTGALFQIYDSEGKALFDSPVALNSLGRLVVKDIPFGIYYWEEIKAPEGYERIVGRHAFPADGSGNVITVEDHRLFGSVTLKKHDLDDAGLKLLPGAAFELSGSNGEKVFTDADYCYSPEGGNHIFVTGEEGEFTITGLPWGSYTFNEITAPEGYEVSSLPISFIVGKNSYDAADESIKVAVDAYDQEKTASLRLTKRDSTDGKGIDGAVYSLYRVGEDEDTLISSGLKSGRDGEIEVNGLKFGTYYFLETMNPSGYLLPDEGSPRSDTVTLDANTAGMILEMEHTNDRMKGNVILRKTDETGRPVAGAGFDLYSVSEEGEERMIGSYVTGGGKEEEGCGEIAVNDLEWGDYYFTETYAPDGYVLSDERINFSIDRVSVQDTILLDVMNERRKGSVKLTKTDRQDSEKHLAGAEFELCFMSGKPCVLGVDYQLPEGIDHIVTGEDGSITLTGLEQGAYYFKETAAPKSYSLTSDVIRFSITMENSAITQELTVEDERGGAVLTIDKEVSSVYDAFGDAVFIFKITRSDGVVYFESLTLTPSVTEGEISLNVEQGYTYTVEEISVSRYLPALIMGIENVTADKEKHIATADLVDNARAEVKFYNEEEQYEKFSHTDCLINSVKGCAQLTGITAEYTGPDPITKDLPGFDEEQEIYLIPSEDILVRAFYDDGNSEILKAEDYILMPSYADGNSDSYTGTVSVFKNGVQRSASFSFGINLPVPEPRSIVAYELNGGRIIPPGEDNAKDSYRLRVKNGSLMERPVNDPFREGYSFMGWFLDRALKESAEFPFTVTEDTTIYAKWEHEPVNVRYAVSIYGIGADTDSPGNTSGLTFGPALGDVWLNSSRHHVPSEGQLCLHSMTWDEIAACSSQDPEVFRECLQNGCTHAVDLVISGGLAENVDPFPSMEGDGASALSLSVSETYRDWNDSLAILDPGPLKDSLFDALPEELRKAVMKKKVMGSDVKDEALWLFSVSELFPSSDGYPVEGKLYERQNRPGSEMNLTAFAEDGRRIGFWLRSEADQENAYIISESGMPEKEDKGKALGISFGFCLPGPIPATRVAVSLYGIRHDICMEENGDQRLAGLTFGPALSGDYRESYVSHVPSGESARKNAHRCIHDDDWRTIALWSEKDPYVYEQCLGDEGRESCTRSIDIFLNDKLYSGDCYFGGDGPGVIYSAISSDSLSWCYACDLYDMAVNDGGWPASYIRAVLNGADAYTNKQIDGSDAIALGSGKLTAGEDPPKADESLFNCLPSAVREHIIPKAVISDTWYSDTDTTGHTMTTYDKLWMFSVHELFPSGKNSTIRQNEGEPYEKVISQNINGDKAEARLKVYNETGEGRLFLRSIVDNNRTKHYGVNRDGSLYKDEVYMSNLGIGFGFCLR